MGRAESTGNTRETGTAANPRPGFIYGRVTKVKDGDSTTRMAFGVNAYYDKHNLKVQADVVKQIDPDSGNSIDAVEVMAGINF